MHQTLRGEVMEKGVAIEAGITGILGYILNIEPEASKSLGNKNFALSLTAKVNLLTDLKFVPKEIGREFQIFAEIRNKFAHLQAVDNFTKCFEIIDGKKYLLDTFAKNLPADTEEEIKLQVAFDFMCMHLGLWMNLILERSKYLKMQDVKKNAVVEMLRMYLGGEIPPEGSEQENKLFEQLDILVKQIDQDKDFMESVQKAIETGEKVASESEEKK